MTSTRTVAIILACCLGLVACDGPDGQEAPEADPTGPRPLPSATAVRELAPTPDEKGRYEVMPISAEVEVGVPYSFKLFTRCGLDVLVDFNGAFWETVDSAGSRKTGPPEGFETPRDPGVMTLVNQELAEFESSQGVVVRFIRQTGTDRTKKIKPCPADQG